MTRLSRRRFVIGSTTFTLQVTSASSAPLGTYQVAANASDPQQTGHSASASATYTVQDTTAPTARANLTAAVSKSTKLIQLSWSASSDNVGVAGYRIWRNTSAAGTSASTSWIDPASSTRGTYTYWVAAYDAAGSVSAVSNSVTVTVGASGGKK